MPLYFSLKDSTLWNERKNPRDWWSNVSRNYNILFLIYMLIRIYFNNYLYLLSINKIFVLELYWNTWKEWRSVIRFRLRSAHVANASQIERPESRSDSLMSASLIGNPRSTGGIKREIGHRLKMVSGKITGNSLQTYKRVALWRHLAKESSSKINKSLFSKKIKATDVKNWGINLSCDNLKGG